METRPPQPWDTSWFSKMCATTSKSSIFFLFCFVSIEIQVILSEIAIGDFIFADKILTVVVKSK